MNKNHRLYSHALFGTLRKDNVPEDQHDLILDIITNRARTMRYHADTDLQELLWLERRVANLFYALYLQNLLRLR